MYLAEHEAGALRRMAADTRALPGLDHPRGDRSRDGGVPGRTTAFALGRSRPRKRRGRGAPCRRDPASGARAFDALIVDAGALYAAVDASDPDHRATVELLEGWPGELVVSGFTAAEADYLILSRLGIDAELAYLDDLVNTFAVHTPDGRGLEWARELCERYRDLALGLADASIVLLARRS